MKKSGYSHPFVGFLTLVLSMPGPGKVIYNSHRYTRFGLFMSPMSHPLKAVVVLSIALFLAGPAFAGDPRPFVKGSYQEILNENQGLPFLMVLWSIDCPPCHKEMAMLGGMLKQHPEMKLILVGTDQSLDRKALDVTLDRHQVRAAQNWVFSQEVPERLRYEIDPQWYGELPRSYFFDAGHQRIGKSGQLTEEVMSAWLKQIAGK
jgi:hypothetical protein